MEIFCDGRLNVMTGDITKLDVECIVNAANSSLLGGGGVDGAIHRAGGEQILKECRDIRNHRYPNGLPAGKAVITSGGNLSADYVIHAVGPVWHGGDQKEDRILASAYAAGLSLCTETGIKSVAFPAISTGAYGFPKERAAKIAYKTISEHLRDNSLPRTVTVVFFTPKHSEIFLASIEHGA